MTAWEFSLATRYVDNLLLLSLVFMMVALRSDSLYTIGAVCLLLVYMVYLYFMDKYMFLRHTRQTYYTSPKLDQANHYLLCFPIAILFLWPLGYIDLSLKYANVSIFLGNIVIYLAVARLCQKLHDP